MKIPGKYRQLARQISRYISDNLDRPLRINDICHRFGISDFTLKRIFRCVYKQGFHHVIIEKRLQKARLLLRTTSLPIKQIAGLAGFRSVTAFTHAFKKRFHITPGALRNNPSAS